jgi:hypothetical protein
MRGMRQPFSFFFSLFLNYSYGGAKILTHTAISNYPYIFNAKYGCLTFNNNNCKNQYKILNVICTKKDIALHSILHSLFVDVDNKRYKI